MDFRYHEALQPSPQAGELNWFDSADPTPVEGLILFGRQAERVRSLLR